MSPVDLLLAAGLVAGASASAALLVILLTRRAAEVHPRANVGAPLRWMVLPNRAGILHRRLRAAVRDLHLDVGRPRRRPTRAVDQLAAEVTDLAVATDREIVAVARRSSTTRRGSWPTLTHRVDQISSLAQEVRGLARDTGDTARSTPVGDDEWHERAARIRRRTEAHREALREVDDLERHLGLG